MSITCQVCATVNPDTAQFCDGCGVELASQTSGAAPVSPTPTPADPAQAAPMDSGAATEMQTTPALDASAPVTGTEAAPDLTGEGASLDTGLADMPAPGDSTSEASSASAVAPASDPALTSAGMSSEAPAQETPMSTEATTPPLASEAPATDTAGAAPVPVEAVEPTPTDSAAPTPSADAVGSEAAGAVAAGAATAGARTGAARLGIRKFGAATGDFIPLQGEKLVVGRFDASSGPVDIDLSTLGGAEHISRRHAELSQQGGQWSVTDLGSTNGVFIKRKGQGAFSPRLQEPTALSDGDEVAFGNLVLTFHQD